MSRQMRRDWFKSRIGSGCLRRKRSDLRLPNHRLLRHEPLEDRRLLAAVTVTTLADTIDFTDGKLSLREAIFAANTVPGADTIEFAPALFAAGPAKILLTQGELAITDALAINGPGAGELTIDASGSDSDLRTPRNGSRIFNVDDKRLDAIDVTIRGLTLTGGDSAEIGGAILSRENLHAQALVVTGNHAARGGAIGMFIAGGDSTIVDCTLSANAAESGGAISISTTSGLGSLLITGSTCNENSASQQGGAIFLTPGSNLRTTIRSSVLAGNFAANQGGALFSSGAGNLSIVDSNISGNHSSATSTSLGRGGGIYATGSSIAISGSTISGNHAVTGGGVYSRNGQLTVNFCSVQGNTASAGDGGGILSQMDRLTLIGSTISGNRAEGPANGQVGRGGGLFHVPGFIAPSTLLDDVISDNQAANDGGGLYLRTTGESPGSTSLTLNNLTIAGNVARRSGGGVATGPQGGGGGTVVVNGGSIINNSSVLNGGGMYLRGGLSVVGTTITGNHADGNGGGVATAQNTSPLVALSFVSATIEGNSAGFADGVFTGDGGGIWIPGGTGALTVLQSSISGNSARAGGGIFRRSTTSLGSLTLRDATFSGNTAGSSGGGLYNQGGLVSIYRSTISANSARSLRGAGAGIFNRQADLSINQSSLTGNSAAQGQGGGVYHSGGDVSVASCTIAGNFAPGDGGGAWISVSTNEQTTIIASTVSGNSSQAGTGGLFVNGPTTIRHSTIARNTALEGDLTTGGVAFNARSAIIELDHTIIALNVNHNSSSPDVRALTSGTFSVIRSSLIGDARGTTLVEAPLGAPDLNGNLIGKSAAAGGSGAIDPLLGPLANNGGPTLTHALLPASPALDAGALVTNVPLGYDQRGNPYRRMVDGTGDGIIRIDIGAYESQGVPQFTPGDYNRDGSVDACDYTTWRGTLGQQVAPFAGADGDGDGVVDNDDYAIWKSHFGQGLTYTQSAGSAALAAVSAPASAVAPVHNPPPESPGGKVSLRTSPASVVTHPPIWALKSDTLLAWLSNHPGSCANDGRLGLKIDAQNHGDIDHYVPFERPPAEALDAAFARIGA